MMGHQQYDEQKEEVLRILENLLGGELDLVDACRELTKLYHQGYDFIPIEFVGYDSEMDSIPLTKFRHLWNQQELEKILQSNPYKESVLNSAKKLLVQLKSNT